MLARSRHLLTAAWRTVWRATPGMLRPWLLLLLSMAVAVALLGVARGVVGVFGPHPPPAVVWLGAVLVVLGNLASTALAIAALVVLVKDRSARLRDLLGSTNGQRSTPALPSNAPRSGRHVFGARPHRARAGERR